MTRPDDEGDTTSNETRYPQLNLNTGMSLATVILLLGFGGWIFTLKGDVVQHSDRLTSVEASVRELRAAADSARDRLYESQLALERRLAGIDGKVQDVLNRMQDRRPEPQRQ